MDHEILECPDCGFEFGTDDCTCHGLGLTEDRGQFILDYNAGKWKNDEPR